MRRSWLQKSSVRTETWAVLGLIFLLTWGWQIGVRNLAGACGMPENSPPVGMLIPAFIALIYRMFLDRSAQLHISHSPRYPRLLATGYLAFTVCLMVVVCYENWRCLEPVASRAIASVGSVLWTLLALNLYQRDQGEAFQSAGLGLGPANVAVRIVLGVVVFLLLQPLLNWGFDLGQFQGIQERIEGVQLSSGLYPLGLIGFLLIAIVGGPLGSLIFMFGEEYGWRGFLQDELEGLGRRLAAICIGLVWGLWHIPIILSGVHTYEPTPLGFGLALVFFVLWGIVQSYAVYKTGSVWTAAFLHGLVNGVYAYTLSYLVRPVDKILSFGLGVYGLALMFFVALWLLRDPVWGATTTKPEISIDVQEP